MRTKFFYFLSPEKSNCVTKRWAQVMHCAKYALLSLFSRFTIILWRCCNLDILRCYYKIIIAYYILRCYYNIIRCYRKTQMNFLINPIYTFKFIYTNLYHIFPIYSKIIHMPTKKCFPYKINLK